MPKERKTLFTGYEFTDEELTQAQVFPAINEMYLQNELAIAAETFIVESEQRAELPHLLMLKQAYIRGQIDILKFVLGISEDRKSELQQQLEEKAAAQQAS